MTNSIVSFAAGVINGKYPSPVQADTLQDVLNHIENNPLDSFSRVRMTLTNGFDSNGVYVPAKFKGYHEDEFCTVGEFSRGFKNYPSDKTIVYTWVIKITPRYLHDTLDRLSSDSLDGLIQRMKCSDCRGVLVITLPTVNIRETKEFKVII